MKRMVVLSCSMLLVSAAPALAQKALADTTVRAPFAGVVGERFVSMGDYVTRGTKVATVMRVDPLRVELTVPEQFVSAIATGRSVTRRWNGTAVVGPVGTTRRWPLSLMKPSIGPSSSV